MKFESKFGIGEIVEWSIQKPGDAPVSSQFMEIAGVTFGKASVSGELEHVYLCRHPDGRIVHLGEHELNGDPEFDQETGYPDEVS